MNRIEEIHTLATESTKVTAYPALGVGTISDAQVGGEPLTHPLTPGCFGAVDISRPANTGVKPGNALDRFGIYLRCKFIELQRKTGLYQRELESFIAFSRELLTGPLKMGAVCPSSAFLAQAMAGELERVDDGLVLELGAGTGSITSALLARGVAPDRLLVVERSAVLAAHLRRRFPAIRVIEGDARQLNTLVGDQGGQLRAVVSGLPFRTMPSAVVAEIKEQIRQLLPVGTVFVQFTYDLSRPSVQMEEALQRVGTRVVWRNLPPARVDRFIRLADSEQG